MTGSVVLTCACRRTEQLRRLVVVGAHSGLQLSDQLVGEFAQRSETHPAIRPASIRQDFAVRIVSGFVHLNLIRRQRSPNALNMKVFDEHSNATGYDEIARHV